MGVKQFEAGLKLSKLFIEAELDGTGRERTEEMH